MSTPFDINVPVGMNEDVVLNMEDGTQVVGTPAELVEAVNAGNIIGLHVNPAVIPDPNAPATAPENVTPNPDAPADPSQTTGVDNNPAPDVPAPDAPAPEEPVAPEETPVEADTAKLDEDVKTLETDEVTAKK